MSVLTNTDIKKFIFSGRLRFNPPPDEFQMRDASVDLRIGTTIQRFRFPTEEENFVLDPLTPFLESEITELEPGETFLIPPAGSVILTTLEEITMPDNLCGILMPRTTVNRQGWGISLTGQVDPNFKGRLFIPVINFLQRPVRIRPGLRFVQIHFQYVSSPVKSPKGSRYTNEDIAEKPKSIAEKDESDWIIAGTLKRLKKTFPLTSPPTSFPYLPEGRKILYVPADNPFMESAKETAFKESLDDEMPTGSVLVQKGKIISQAANGSAYHKEHGCERVRLGCKTGEGYELCKGCHPKNHSERKSIKDAETAGRSTKGADLYLWGHWWVCKDCWETIEDAGVKSIYLLEGSQMLFNKDAPGNTVGQQREFFGY